MKLHRSVLMIEDWWIRTNNRRVFRVLKETICAAVSSMCSCVAYKGETSQRVGIDRWVISSVAICLLYSKFA